MSDFLNLYPNGLPIHNPQWNVPPQPNYESDWLARLVQLEQERDAATQRAEAAEELLRVTDFVDSGFCPHCHQDELRGITDAYNDYDDEEREHVQVYHCAACGAAWAGDPVHWVDSEKQLAAATARAETAEQQLMVYRVLLTGAMCAAAYDGGMPPSLGPFATGYFTELFHVALNSGALADEGCGTTGILAVAEQLHVKFPPVLE